MVCNAADVFDSVFKSAAARAYPLAKSEGEQMHLFTQTPLGKRMQSVHVRMPCAAQAVLQKRAGGADAPRYNTEAFFKRASGADQSSADGRPVEQGEESDNIAGSHEDADDSKNPFEDAVRAMMGKIEEQRGYTDDYQALEHMARHSAAGKELLRSFAAHHLAARASVK